MLCYIIVGSSAKQGMDRMPKATQFACTIRAKLEKFLHDQEKNPRLQHPRRRALRSYQHGARFRLLV